VCFVEIAFVFSQSSNLSGKSETCTDKVLAKQFEQDARISLDLKPRTHLDQNQSS